MYVSRRIYEGRDRSEIAIFVDRMQDQWPNDAVGGQLALKADISIVSLSPLPFEERTFQALTYTIHSLTFTFTFILFFLLLFHVVPASWAPFPRFRWADDCIWT